MAAEKEASLATHEMTITDAEVLADFEAALGLGGIVEDPAAMTINELAERFKCKRQASKARAEKAVEAGLFERVKVRRDTGWGTRTLIAYRLVKGEG